jgi:hypothetical protein
MTAVKANGSWMKSCRKRFPGKKGVENHITQLKDTSSGAAVSCILAARHKAPLNPILSEQDRHKCSRDFIQADNICINLGEYGSACVTESLWRADDLATLRPLTDFCIFWFEFLAYDVFSTQLFPVGSKSNQLICCRSDLAS